MTFTIKNSVLVTSSLLSFFSLMSFELPGGSEFSHNQITQQNQLVSSVPLPHENSIPVGQIFYDPSTHQNYIITNGNRMYVTLLNAAPAQTIAPSLQAQSYPFPSAQTSTVTTPGSYGFHPGNPMLNTSTGSNSSPQQGAFQHHKESAFHPTASYQNTPSSAVCPPVASTTTQSENPLVTVDGRVIDLRNSWDGTKKNPNTGQTSLKNLLAQKQELLMFTLGDAPARYIGTIASGTVLDALTIFKIKQDGDNPSSEKITKPEELARIKTQLTEIMRIDAKDKQKRLEFAHNLMSILRQPSPQPEAHAEFIDTTLLTTNAQSSTGKQSAHPTPDKPASPEPFVTPAKAQSPRPRSVSAQLEQVQLPQAPNILVTTSPTQQIFSKPQSPETTATNITTSSAEAMSSKPASPAPTTPSSAGISLFKMIESAFERKENTDTTSAKKPDPLASLMSHFTISDTSNMPALPEKAASLSTIDDTLRLSTDTANTNTTEQKLSQASINTDFIFGDFDSNTTTTKSPDPVSDTTQSDVPTTTISVTQQPPVHDPYAQPTEVVIRPIDGTHKQTKTVEVETDNSSSATKPDISTPAGLKQFLQTTHSQTHFSLEQSTAMIELFNKKLLKEATTTECQKLLDVAQFDENTKNVLEKIVAKYPLEESILKKVNKIRQALKKQKEEAQKQKQSSKSQSATTQAAPSAPVPTKATKAPRKPVDKSKLLASLFKDNSNDSSDSEEEVETVVENNNNNEKLPTQTTLPQAAPSKVTVTQNESRNPTEEELLTQSINHTQQQRTTIIDSVLEKAEKIKDIPQLPKDDEWVEFLRSNYQQYCLPFDAQNREAQEKYQKALELICSKTEGLLPHDADIALDTYLMVANTDNPDEFRAAKEAITKLRKNVAAAFTTTDVGNPSKQEVLTASIAQAGEQTSVQITERVSAKMSKEAGLEAIAALHPSNNICDLSNPQVLSQFLSNPEKRDTFSEGFSSKIIDLFDRKLFQEATVNQCTNLLRVTSFSKQTLPVLEKIEKKFYLNPIIKKEATRIRKQLGIQPIQTVLSVTAPVVAAVAAKNAGPVPKKTMTEDEQLKLLAQQNAEKRKTIVDRVLAKATEIDKKQLKNLPIDDALVEDLDKNTDEYCLSFLNKQQKEQSQYQTALLKIYTAANAETFKKQKSLDDLFIYLKPIAREKKG